MPLLLNELISILEAEQRGSVLFNSGAIESLSRHSWLGNVRELANLVERMAILYPHGIVGVNDLPENFQYFEGGEKRVTNSGASVVGKLTDSILELNPHESLDQTMLPLSGIDLKTYLANLERDLILQALDFSDGVVARAAQRLRIRRTTLVEKMRKYQLLKKQSSEEKKMSVDDRSETTTASDSNGIIEEKSASI